MSSQIRAVPRQNVKQFFGERNMFETLPTALVEHVELLATNTYLEKMKPCSPGVTVHPFFTPNGPKSCIPSVETRQVKVPIPDELRVVYERYPDDTEFSVHDSWTFLSEREIAERQNAMVNEGQSRFVDIAVSYAGMGHVYVLSYDIRTRMVFTGLDGGANGWDRESNHKRRMQTDPATPVPFKNWWCSSSMTSQS